MGWLVFGALVGLGAAFFPKHKVAGFIYILIVAIAESLYCSAIGTALLLLIALAILILATSIAKIGGYVRQRRMSWGVK